MDEGGLLGDEIIDRPRPRAARATTTPAAAATSSTASRAPSARPSSSTRSPPSGRSTSSSTSTCPATWCSAGSVARRVCLDCGTNYVASGVERMPWICDVCGGDVHAARRRHARGDHPPARPLRGADRAADRVLPERTGASSWSTASTRPSRLPRLIAAVDAARGRAEAVKRREVVQCAQDRLRTRRASSRLDARRRPGGGRDARGDPRRRAPGRDDAASSIVVARDVLAPQRGDVELPRLPRLPGRDLRVGQRRAHPRHPRPGVLDDGDVLELDCGAIVDGWHGDAAFTMGVGTITPEAQRLIAVADEALAAGIAAMRPGGHLGDIGAAIDDGRHRRRLRQPAGSTAATASAGRCTSTPTSRTAAAAGAVPISSPASCWRSSRC